MHPLAWVAWVTLVMTVALITTNPLYLGVALLCVLLVSALAPRTGTGLAGFRALLIFGTGMFAVSLLIATVNGNYGDHILFTIPGPAIPHWLGGLRLGGPVSAEGLVAASIRGLAILCVLLAFGVFNGAVSPHRVLHSTPAAIFHAGLVVTVGLTLLPASIEDIRRIREMRALRGARAGLRQLPALVVPAVINGLERSMRLAEAMEARGYGAAPPGPRGPQLVGAASVPLFVAAAWGWYYYEWSRPFAVAAAVAGVAALGFWGVSAARGRHTTRFHAEPMPLADRACIALSAAGCAIAIVGGSAGWFALKYNPFAGLPAPEFSLWGALLALSCGWPAVRMALAPAQSAEPEPVVVASSEAVRT
jgi:energy-coupling factor transport system permease protein